MYVCVCELLYKFVGMLMLCMYFLQMCVRAYARTFARSCGLGKGTRNNCESWENITINVSKIE